jgi:hypothetical protein
MLHDHDDPGSISDHFITGFMVSGSDRGYFRVLRFPLPVLTPLNAFLLISSVKRGSCSGPFMAEVPRFLVSSRPNNKIIWGKYLITAL